jgi:hypothetical protein
MGSIDALVRDLRGFSARGEVIKQLRKRIREPVPTVRRAIKSEAVAILPHSGGLGKWVAATRITATIKINSRTARVTLKGGRNSKRGRSDIRAIDRGRVRAPSWGHRGPGAWHTESVPAGFFTRPAAEAHEWRAAIDAAADEALDTIRRG